jgi:Tfp pilus assembly protein PilO
MKLNTREIGLAWVTAITVILGGTYWFAQPKVQEWKDIDKAMQTLQLKKKESEHLLGGRDDVNRRLDEIRGQLPAHPVGKDVTAELLRMLERTAQQNGVSLLRREAERERSAGDIYEVAINCNWEGDLDAVVRFLYALQSQGAILDVRQLTMSPIPGGRVRLKGNCTVDFAYTRSAAGVDSVQTTPAPEG